MDESHYAELRDFEDRHWWFIGRRAIAGKLIDRLPLRRDASILEIGCGSGGNLPMLSHYGTLYAAEHHAASRRIARARGVAVAVADCLLPDNFPFDGRFDLIAMFDVLEHIEDDHGALCTCREHLDGCLVLTVPTFPFLWSEHDRRLHHKRRYTKRSLHELLSAAGFTVRYMSHINMLLFPAIAAARTWKTFTRSTQTDLAMPAAWMNAFLARLFSAERYAMGRVSLPFGVSLIAVAGRGPEPEPRHAGSLRQH
jgi:SAM-dependent methyltransferase